LNTVKHQQEKVTDDYFLLDKVSRLWLQGQGIDWKSFHKKERRYRLALPGYPFEGKRYWLDPKTNLLQAGSDIKSFARESPSTPDTGVSTPPESSPGFETPQNQDNNPEAPRNELEQFIVKLWQEFLGIDRVGIHDDFFYLNGNSLIGTQLLARLFQEYQVEIPANRFYEEPTAAHLAQLIQELEGQNNDG
jgi:acyl carrier protein